MGDLYTKTFVATDYQLTVLLYNFDVDLPCSNRSTLSI